MKLSQQNVITHQLKGGINIKMSSLYYTVSYTAECLTVLIIQILPQRDIVFRKLASNYMTMAKQQATAMNLKLQNKIQ
jgi:hypothetical protein